MFIDDPKSVRFEERKAKGLATINGVSIADAAKNREMAQQIVQYRTERTVEAINKAIANKGTLPAPARR